MSDEAAGAALGADLLDRPPCIVPRMRRVESRTALHSLIARHTEFSQGLNRLDLSGLDLSSLEGHRRLFERCDFSRCDLSHATLSESRFFKCTFRGANLRSAFLRRASLSACDFVEADLRFADLRDASLGVMVTGDGSGTNDFRGASLEGARLAGADGIDEARWDELPSA